MAKLTDFKTPMGASGNLLSPTSWIQLIIGAFVFLLTFAIGQNLLQKAGSKLPIDTQIDPLINRPAISAAAPQKQVF